MEARLDLCDNDPEGLYHVLREAHRQQNLEKLFQACEKLLVLPEPDIPDDHVVFQMGVPMLTVREALEWAVKYIHEVEAPWTRGLHKFVWGGQWLTRLARLLPNPHPVEELATPMVVYSWIDRYAYTKRFECSMQHALPLYVAGLQMLKGDGWWRWWYARSRRATARIFTANEIAWHPEGWRMEHVHDEHPDDEPWARNELHAWLTFGNTNVRVFDDGTIECGEICPPLPATE